MAGKVGNPYHDAKGLFTTAAGVKKFLDDQPTLPAGNDFISNKSIGIPVYTGQVNLPKFFRRKVKSQSSTDVNLSDIVSGQNYLQKSKILSILSSSSPPTEPIVLVNQDNKLIMTDGNHRLASAKLRGDKTINAVVIHSDAYMAAKRRK